MKNLKFHFIGIGGVGMSGIALLVSGLGASVSGSDLEETLSVKMLSNQGVDVVVGPHSAGNVPNDVDVVVFSSAVKPDNPERIRADQLNVRVVRRGEFLAELAKEFDFSIAVSGSHGKTTTTAMMAHILKESGKNPAFMVGGKVIGWQNSAGIGDAKILVTEIDESDGTQAFFHANCAVILNIEDDHAWSAGGREKLFDSFRKVANQSQKTFAWGGEFPNQILQSVEQVEFLNEDKIPEELSVPQVGAHNRYNAYAALKAVGQVGISEKQAIEALKSFPGVDRRMTTLFENENTNFTLLEDYAHHPTELRSLLNALHESWPNRSINLIFQPHRFERVKRYGSEFAVELSAADSVVVVSPFAAWCNDSDLANPKQIADEIVDTKKIYIDVKNDDFTEVVNHVKTNFPKENSVIAIVGAGTITRIGPNLTDYYEID